MRHTTPKYRSLAELCALNRTSYDALRGWLADLERIEAAPLDPKRDIGEQLDKRGRQVDELVTRIAALVPTATIPVADGRAVYAVLYRDGEWMVFQWLHGGPDGYVSPFGDLVAVPLETGKRLIGEAAR